MNEPNRQQRVPQHGQPINRNEVRPSVKQPVTGKPKVVGIPKETKRTFTEDELNGAVNKFVTDHVLWTQIDVAIEDAIYSQVRQQKDNARFVKPLQVARMIIKQVIVPQLYNLENVQQPQQSPKSTVTQPEDIEIEHNAEQPDIDTDTTEITEE